MRFTCQLIRADPQGARGLLNKMPVQAGPSVGFVRDRIVFKFQFSVLGLPQDACEEPVHASPRICASGGLDVIRLLYCPPLPPSTTRPRKTRDGFAVPQPGHRFVFPRDYGSHPEFAIEWWY